MVVILLILYIYTYSGKDRIEIKRAKGNVFDNNKNQIRNLKSKYTMLKSTFSLTLPILWTKT